MADVTITECDPSSPDAASMAAALWDEVQTRYGFTADDPFDPAAFAGPVGRFWVARSGTQPVGSIALMPFEDGVAEMDVMYVAPSHRGSGVARELLDALEDHARRAGIVEVRLRAGDPQPEAMRFYAKSGFTPIPSFGRWVDDPTARCLARRIEP